ncbi:hypothetical protein [uncultured Duncaniella sp.]|uniref:hypothetical protein n=1 Tax=uncultured Duncaniella sp. TaxID=2768039 RepID=UPI00263674B2|nr:hypothetical protein [uncultured Duncaniella sp.]
MYNFENGEPKIDAMMETLSKVFTDNLKERYSFGWDGNRTPSLLHTTLATMANMLKSHQNVKKPNTACVLKDFDGNFKLALIMHYMPADEEAGDDAGNWVLEATFDESEIGDVDEMYDNFSDEFGCWADNIANQVMNGRFRTLQFMTEIMCELINSVKMVMDACDVEATGSVSMVYGGVVTITVTLEDGKKVMSIIPGETIKQIIKADDK